jgi:hypothetical protein
VVLTLCYAKPIIKFEWLKGILDRTNVTDPIAMVRDAQPHNTLTMNSVAALMASHIRYGKGKCSYLHFFSSLSLSHPLRTVERDLIVRAKVTHSMQMAGCSSFSLPTPPPPPTSFFDAVALSYLFLSFSQDYARMLPEIEEAKFTNQPEVFTPNQDRGALFKGTVFLVL